MMQSIKKITFINGSPKMTLQSTSGFLASYGEDRLKADEFVISRVNIRQSISQNSTEHAFEDMLNADTLILTFPLFIFCLPGITIRFLQDYYQYFSVNREKSKNTKVYAIVNCGFPEAFINEEAVRVIECFSKRIGANFRFGIMMGGGGMLVEAKDAPFMKKIFIALDDSFKLMAEDIRDNHTEALKNISINLTFPRKPYLFMADRGWISMARKNGLKKKDLYRKPYEC